MRNTVLTRKPGLAQNAVLKDAFGLGVVIFIIGAAQAWSAILGA